MNRKIVVASVTLAIAVVALAAVIIVFYNPRPQPLANELPDGEPPQWQIDVKGNVEEEKTWTLTEISKMPLTEVTTTSGENATYRGVTLTDFCNKTGMLWDTGTIDVIGVDGKKATINIFQAWNSTAYPYYQDENRITLVFIKDGQWMTEENGGPVRLVAPYFSSEYQIEHVSEVRIGHWTISISGAVSNPLTISSKKLSAFQEETVQAEFVPGEGRRTSNWTGLSVLDVLQQAGMSYGAEKITIVAIDGYVKNYTLQEVEEAHMLIGYMENDNHFWQDQGGPFRLFCTVDKYKWAQFWVKFVHEIIVY